MGFTAPSKIQEIALPNLLGNPPSKLNFSSKNSCLNNLFI
jgi:hypothetical protein